MKTHTLKWIFDTLTIGLFLAVMILPLLVMITTPARKNSKVERRSLIHEVNFDHQALPQSVDTFDNYVKDQIGFRENIIYWNNFIKIKYLHYSPVKSVIIGSDGWLYYKDEIPDHRHETQFTDRELRLMCQTLEARQYWLSAQGITYLFLIAPNKSTIYPEYVPSAYTRINPDSALDQLTDYLQNNCPVPFIDLRAKLLEEKQRQQVYFAQDTHWNFVGAYVTYKAIIDYLAANDILEGAALSNEDTIIVPTKANNDLALLMGIPEAFAPEYTDLIQPAQPCDVEISPFRFPSNITGQTRTCEKNTINLVAFHDSFFGTVIPLLAEHFKTSDFIETPYSPSINKEMIQKNQPQIVIDELVERNLRVYFLNNIPTDFQETSRDIFGILPYSYGHYRFNSEPLGLAAPTIANAAATFAGYGLHIVAPNSETSPGTSDPQIIFSLPEIPADEMIVVRMWLSIPQPTNLEVLHAGTGSVFDTAHSVTANVATPGEYEFYLAFRSSVPVSLLRIDPGNVPGDYIVHEIEIRSSYMKPE